MFRTHWTRAGSIIDVSVRTNENNCPLVKAFIWAAFLNNLTISEVAGISMITKLVCAALAYTWYGPRPSKSKIDRDILTNVHVPSIVNESKTP